ncbi:MAG: hypothetical protein WBZ42_01710, partial [Halobacteriota archaeon]
VRQGCKKGSRAHSRKAPHRQVAALLTAPQRQLRATRTGLASHKAIVRFALRSEIPRYAERVTCLSKNDKKSGNAAECSCADG